MSKHFGVKCGRCKTPIILGDLEEFVKDKFPVYVIPLTAITCHCGYTAQYGSKDKIEFETQD